ncbi:MAG: response regulator transcription factor [Hyphomicrobium sp.]|uniref:LuxR C-terminal-related transcriptional regulator n=1 Tax=Hyphomicrobium sp. TaxID=82 RepID=UPI0039E441BF
MSTPFQQTEAVAGFALTATDPPKIGLVNSNSGDASPLTPSIERLLIVIEPRGFVRNCIVSSFSNIVNFGCIGLASVRDYLARDSRSGEAIVVLCAMGMSAAETASQLNQLATSGCNDPLVVMSDSDDGSFIMTMMENGAKGFMPTDISLELAGHALRLVMAGGQYFPIYPWMAAKQLSEEMPRTGKNWEGIFTRRQIAVIDALRKGKANKIIAYELNMCESTVKVHVRNIMKKLNAKNRTEVAYLASELLGAQN